MSGSRRSAAPMPGGRYSESWTKAAKMTSGQDRADDRYLEEHGWSTAEG